MAAHELRVLICSVPAGTLQQDATGLISFTYDAAYQGVPLSLSMPLSNRTYAQDTVRPYLFGLLPDSETQRMALVRDFGVRPNNPFALLAHIGLDCPGGVQFCDPAQEAAAIARAGSYEPLTERVIANRLRRLREQQQASWLGLEERWSLGGNQGKFALGWHHGRWCSCIGSAPTTHICKNGVAGFRLQALNEFVCMETAAAVGVRAAPVDYRFFEDEPALIVERYDRIAEPNGTIRRLHQEDLCQALSVMPAQKYTADGGPAARDILQLLAHTANARYNMAAFTQALFFNCLIGAPDAHAKNYSILIGEHNRAVLAPLYDIASGLAYDNVRRSGRLAMSIGGENRFGRVGSGALKRYCAPAFCAEHGLTFDVCQQLYCTLARDIPVAMASVFDAHAALPGIAELRERLLPPVEENCKRSLAIAEE